VDSSICSTSFPTDLSSCSVDGTADDKCRIFLLHRGRETSPPYCFFYSHTRKPSEFNLLDSSYHCVPSPRTVLKSHPHLSGTPCPAGSLNRTTKLSANQASLTATKLEYINYESSFIMFIAHMSSVSCLPRSTKAGVWRSKPL
jgi:hypothetical protein